MSNNNKHLKKKAAQLLALLLALAMIQEVAASTSTPHQHQHGPRRLLLGGQKYFLALNDTSGILIKPAKRQLHRELGASTPPAAAVVVKMQGAAAVPVPSRDAALSLKVNTNSSQQPLVVLELGRGSSNSSAEGGPAAAAAGSSNQDLQQSAKQQLGGPASSRSSSSSTEMDAASAAASEAAAAVAAAPSASNNPVLLASRQRSQAMFTSGPGGYWYAPATNSSSVPLGMPVSESGLPLTRWVMCAWGVSNFSSPLMLTSDAMVQAQTL